MRDLPPQKREKIEVATWNRRAMFEFFRQFSEPYHGICVRVDCTATYKYAKKHRLSVSLSLLHRSLVAAHEVENFRFRIVNGEPWRYEEIKAGGAIGRLNGTIVFGYYDYHFGIEEFVRGALLEVERVRMREDLEPYPEENVIRYSTLPWLDFTSLSHARDLEKGDSAPRITFGKITDAGGHRTMPVSIHVHHALVDGLHVAQFVERFQANLDEPNAARIQVR